MLRVLKEAFKEKRAEKKAEKKQKFLNEQFRKAVLAHNEEEVLRYLEAGANPDYSFGEGYIFPNAITYSVAFGHDKILAHLLAFEVDTNARSLQNESIRDLAKMYGHEKVTQLLIAANLMKAETQVKKTNGGLTYLMERARNAGETKASEDNNISDIIPKKESEKNVNAKNPFDGYVKKPASSIKRCEIYNQTSFLDEETIKAAIDFINYESRYADGIVALHGPSELSKYFNDQANKIILGGRGHSLVTRNDILRLGNEVHVVLRPRYVSDETENKIVKLAIPLDKFKELATLKDIKFAPEPQRVSMR